MSRRAYTISLMALFVCAALGCASEAVAWASAPTLLSPAGAITTALPTYRWTPAAGAVAYMMQIFDADGNLVFQQLYGAEACSASECSVPADMRLSVGPAYTWYLKGRDEAGQGDWAEGTVFWVEPLPTPTLLAPADAVANPQPVYAWTASNGATGYRLGIQNSAGQEVFAFDYPTEWVCVGSSCSAQTFFTLANGDYTWWIRAGNPGAVGDWVSRTFTVVGPPAPALLGPSGTVTIPKPAFSWQASAGATGYQLDVLNSEGNSVLWENAIPGSVCASGTCSFASSTSLTVGNDTWRVRATHAGGRGDWSNSLSISVQGPPVPAMSAPAGVTTTPLPVYRWSASAGATSYSLETDNAAGARVYLVGYDAAAVCSSGSCAVDPGVVLPLGQYNWYLRANGAVGSGPWSAAKEFSVDGPPPPTLVAPSGTVTIPKPVFSWRASSGATGYQLELLNGTTSVLFENAIPGSVCSGNTCSFTSASNLTVGNYTWRVRGTHAAGRGDWGTSLSIAVQGPPVPAMSAPAGATTNPLPVYRWSASAGATSYSLETDKSDGARVYLIGYNAVAVCSSGACGADPGVVLPIGQYKWYLRGNGAVGSGEWSAAKAFEVQGPPPPTLVGPSGTVTIPKPVFSWRTSANATGYQLDVLNSSGTSVLWESAIPASVCVSGTCSFTSSTSLTVGNDTWHVRGTHAGGRGDWSASLSISVQGPPVPAMSAPAGATTNPLPTYSWTASAGATSYTLETRNSADARVYLIDYAATAVCSGSACSAAPGTALANGQYSWYLRGNGAVGSGEWSAAKAFEVQGPPPPTLVGPSGTVTIPKPVFSWRTSANATGYQLDVLNSSGTSVLWESAIPASVCVSGTCSFTSGSNLPIGNFTWHVRGTHAGGRGDWSAPLAISVQGPPVPAMSAPSGVTTNPLPVYRWSASAGATSYTLETDKPDGARVYLIGYDAVAVCSSGACGADPGVVLPIGQYKWYLRANGAVGSGPWSGAKAFEVQGPPPPTLLGPSGAVTIPKPVFSWRTSANATGYQLDVLNGSGTSVLWESAIPASVCVSGTCSFTSGSNLPIGNFTWHVRGTHAGGRGDWSASLAISVQGPPVPAMSAPSGATTNPLPVYRWSASAGATSYTLETDKPDGTRVYLIGYDAAAVCSSGSCSADPGVVLPIGQYKWYLRASGAVGAGEWSGAKEFSVDGAAAPVPGTPSGRVRVPNPTFTWQASAGATGYQLDVVNQDPTEPGLFDNAIPATVCTAGTCSFASGTSLKVGRYTWRVRGTHAGGRGDWSAPTFISVEGPPAPAVSAPSGAIVNPFPSFNWSVSEGATDYQLEIDSAEGGRVFFSGYSAAAACSDGACGVGTGVPLAIGRYVWYVRGLDAVGGGAWTPQVEFSVEGPPPPVPLAPTGVTLEWQPVFSWQPSTGATAYHLEVLHDDGTRVFIALNLPAAAHCTQTSCSATSPQDLTVGDYKWRVLGKHAGGAGDWSSETAFAVQGPSAPVPIGPRGRIFTTTPTFRWWPSQKAAQYYFEVVDSADSRVAFYWMDPQTACGASFCSVVLPDPLNAGGYTWRVLGRDQAGNGPFGALMFTVQSAPRAAPPSNPAPPSPVPPVPPVPTACPIWEGAAQCAYTQYLYDQGRLNAATTPQAHATAELAATSAQAGEGDAGVQATVVTSPIQGVAPCGCPAPGAFVTYQTADVTARAGVDYVPAQGTLVVPRDGATFPIALGLLNNCGEDPARSFRLLLTPGINTAVPEGKGDLLVGILDNDATRVAFTTGTSRVRESGEWLTLPPALRAWREDSACPSRVRNVAITTVSESATSPADFSVPATVAATEGASTDVPVAIANDAAMEGNETFQMQVQAGQAGLLAEEPASNHVTIEDDDIVTAALTLRRVAPCRLLDAQTSPLSAGEERTVVVRTSCGVSANAKAVLLGITVRQGTQAGALEIRVPEAGLPPEPRLPFAAGDAWTTNGHYMLGPNGDIKVKNASTGTVAVLLDVVGYFE